MPVQLCRTYHFCTLFVLLLCFTAGCIPAEHDRSPSRPTGPEELREQTRRSSSRSNNPEHWHVRVTLTSAELDKKTVREAGVNWSISDDHVQRSGGSPPLTSNGLRVGVSGEDVSLSMFAGRSSRTTRRSTSQFVTTLNHQPAMLRLRKREVRERPGQVVIYDHGGRTVLNRYTTRITGFSLRVKPDIVESGPYVRLTLTPVIARPKKRGVEVRELQTTVRVRSGQSVLLASSESTRNTIGRTLFSERSTRSRDNFAWIVTPEIVK